jgi:hypothetical protein
LYILINDININDSDKDDINDNNNNNNFMVQGIFGNVESYSAGQEIHYF